MPDGPGGCDARRYTADRRHLQGSRGRVFYGPKAMVAGVVHLLRGGNVLERCSALRRSRARSPGNGVLGGRCSHGCSVAVHLRTLTAPRCCTSLENDSTGASHPRHPSIARTQATAAGRAGSRIPQSSVRDQGCRRRHTLAKTVRRVRGGGVRGVGLTCEAPTVQRVRRRRGVRGHRSCARAQPRHWQASCPWHDRARHPRRGRLPITNQKTQGPQSPGSDPPIRLFSAPSVSAPSPPRSAFPPPGSNWGKDPTPAGCRGVGGRPMQGCLRGCGRPGVLPGPNQRAGRALFHPPRDAAARPCSSSVSRSWGVMG